MRRSVHFELGWPENLNVPTDRLVGKAINLSAYAVAESIKQAGKREAMEILGNNIFQLLPEVDKDGRVLPVSEDEFLFRTLTELDDKKIGSQSLVSLYDVDFDEKVLKLQIKSSPNGNMEDRKSVFDRFLKKMGYAGLELDSMNQNKGTSEGVKLEFFPGLEGMDQTFVQLDLPIALKKLHLDKNQFLKQVNLAREEKAAELVQQGPIERFFQAARVSYERDGTFFRPGLAYMILGGVTPKGVRDYQL